MTDTPPRLQVVPSPPKSFRRDGLGYVYEPPGAQVRLRCDYIHHRADDITAEVVIESTMPGVPAHLYQGRLNFGASNSKRSLASDLAELSRQAIAKENWREWLEQLSVAVVRTERQGDPFEQVGQLPANTDDRKRYVVDRLLPHGKPTWLYGEGGVGKGWLAVATCIAHKTGAKLIDLTVEKGEPLYLDWEDDRETLDDRVKMVARGMELERPPWIHYRRCRVPLSSQVNQIARFVEEQRVTLIVVDSVGLAAGLAGERGSYEEVALRLFDAMRQIGTGITWLCIDHVSDAGRQNKAGGNKAFGSVYKMYEARMAWEIRKDQELGGTSSHLGLYNTKTNHGAPQKPIGIELDFGEEGVVFLSRKDVSESAELVQAVPFNTRIINVLARGAMRPIELAREMNVDDGKVRTYLGRLEDKGRVQRQPDGRYGLIAQQEPDEPPAPIPF